MSIVLGFLELQLFYKRRKIHLAEGNEILVEFIVIIKVVLVY